MKHLPAVLLVILVSACTNGALPPTTSTAGGCALAERYVQASLQGDPDAVASEIAHDVVALFFSDTDHGEVVEGRSAVLEMVRQYPAQCPGCSSSLVCHHETPRAAYLTETVEWHNTAGETRQQSAPLVLEHDGERITRILYYPAD